MPAAEPISFGRVSLARAAFGLWIGAIVGVLGILGREACENSARSHSAADLGLVASGWTLRHLLPASDPLSRTVAAQLAQRGRLPGITNEIVTTRGADSSIDELRREGWTILESEEIPELRVEILSPDQVLRWSGKFRASDFAVAGAVMLDSLVMRQVVRGEQVAPFVPVGCAPGPTPSRRR